MGDNCPSGTCSWLRDKYYSEDYIDRIYPALGLPRQSYMDPITSTNVPRIAFPREWMCEKPALSGNVVTGTPQVGDVAVMLNGRYCLGQAGIVTAVETTPAGQPCVKLNGVNWLGNCEIYDAGNCYQSCSTFPNQPPPQQPQPQPHTIDPLLPACLTRADLGATGYFLRDPTAPPPSSSSSSSSSSGS